ncbi:MAG: glycoside hydrolase family 3 C-terminal domain-containing protein, partial [Anaerolineae bacterium]|nr:glycoside hydrolase family 3 C-terminal domain-containing protein [Anaerolineae bacterium]
MDKHTFEARARELVARMTLDEKISQMMHSAPAIERLGIPAYNWWNECLHGVGRAGIATVFPQAIGLAATWNVPLIHRIAVAISDEARAKHHDFVRKGIRKIYTGLTFWTPNINIFRDPRWGRGQETYGEDPFLTTRIGVTFVKGLQGDDPTYLKVVATPKHYAVHSGPEHARHTFDVKPSERDLWETYLPAFEACIVEGGAVSIMGAYNRVNREPACASPTLLGKILRERWGFDGFVVSDCGAIGDIYRHHKTVSSAEEAAAMAVKAGCDLECGETYPALNTAVKHGLIDEATIDESVVRLFTARFQLGMFDPPEQVPYAQIPISVNDSPEHRALALQAARESLVLLKNANQRLPLPKDVLHIAVIGPNAHDPEALLGNYNGTPSSSVTPLDGIRAKASPRTEIAYARGCGVFDPDSSGVAEAVALARGADVVIFVGGLSQALEGEEGQQEGLPKGLVSQGDRLHLDLPDIQESLLRALHETGTPIVVV